MWWSPFSILIYCTQYAYTQQMHILGLQLSLNSSNLVFDFFSFFCFLVHDRVANRETELHTAAQKGNFLYLCFFFRERWIETNLLIYVIQVMRRKFKDSSMQKPMLIFKIIMGKQRYTMLSSITNPSNHFTELLKMVNDDYVDFFLIQTIIILKQDQASLRSALRS